MPVEILVFDGPGDWLSGALCNRVPHSEVVSWEMSCEIF